MIDPEAEKLHTEQMKQIAYDAMHGLRDTLNPKFDAVSIGYNDADHARLTIVQQAVKQMNKLSAEHLRKCGK